jgi:choloylglycine hydrolase
MNNKMIRMIMALALLAALGLIQPLRVRACSAFVMNKGNRVIFGRNFDFFTGAGFVTVNPRNTAKTALVFPGNKPAQWVSQYGSVTFNQIGRDFPMGGMNEAGLVVECLWLFQAQYPGTDDRAALTELQWIQYQLDNCRTVEEVVASDRLVRILASATKLHFLVCDRTGRAGVVEFIDGKSVLYSPDRLPVKALANNPYQDCLEALKGFRGFGGATPIPDSSASNERFARMAAQIKGFGSGRSAADIESAFRILKSVRYEGAESPTQWSIVYDPLGMEIHFETRDRAERRSVRVADFNFGCDAVMKVLDLEAKNAGDVTRAFQDYSADANREHTRDIFDLFQKAGYAKDIPEMAIMIVGAYPETTHCQADPKKTIGK